MTDLKSLSPAEFRLWLVQQRKTREQEYAENRRRLSLAPVVGNDTSMVRVNWPVHVPQCPDKAPDGRKCRLKADHPAHENNQHAGWVRVGKAKAWSVWSGGFLSRNHYGLLRNWKKANKSGQTRLALGSDGC